MGVGTRLKKILEEKEVSIKDLSLMTGVSIHTLYGITKRDNDTIKVETLKKIASSLGVPPHYILGLNKDYSGLNSGERWDGNYTDSTDGLLSSIVSILEHFTTEGLLIIYEHVLSLEKQNKYVDTSFAKDQKKFKDWFEIEAEELKKMFDAGLIEEIDYLKANLIIHRKLFLPYTEEDDVEAETEETRIYRILEDVKRRLKPRVLSGELSCPFSANYFRDLPPRFETIDINVQK